MLSLPDYDTWLMAPMDDVYEDGEPLHPAEVLEDDYMARDYHRRLGDAL